PQIGLRRTSQKFARLPKKRGAAMNKPNPQGPQTYQASRRKNFNSLLRYLLRKEFPGTFGPAIARLFADKVEELHLKCHPPLSRVKAGQILWLAVAADE